MTHLSTPPAPAERLHGLDALRAGALLLGVVLHASLSFFPQQIWIVADDSRSIGAAWLFFAIHLFRMTAFFLIAGLFAHRMLARRGWIAFAKDRVVRIAGPLAVFWLRSLSARLYASLCACSAMGCGRRACSISIGTASVSARRYAAVIAARETDCGRICSANSRKG